MINVATPTAATDAATKGYVDTSLATLTGNVVLANTVALSETTGTTSVGMPIIGTVIRVRVLVYAAFTSGAAIQIGTGSSANGLMDTTLIDPTVPGAYVVDVATYYVSATQIIATVTAGSGNTGTAQVLLEYLNH